MGGANSSYKKIGKNNGCRIGKTCVRYGPEDEAFDQPLWKLFPINVLNSPREEKVKLNPMVPYELYLLNFPDELDRFGSAENMMRMVKEEELEELWNYMLNRKRIIAKAKNQRDRGSMQERMQVNFQERIQERMQEPLPRREYIERKDPIEQMFDSLATSVINERERIAEMDEGARLAHEYAQEHSRVKERVRKLFLEELFGHHESHHEGHHEGQECTKTQEEKEKREGQGNVFGREKEEEVPSPLEKDYEEYATYCRYDHQDQV